MEKLTSSLEGLHVRILVSQESGRDWVENVLDWPGTLSDFVMKLDPDGLSGKMSRDVCQLIRGRTLKTSSICWKNAGILSPTEFLTLRVSEFPNVAVESSLSDILEGTGDNLRRYFLSPKACAGILRRSKKRGLKIPDLLEHCLQTVAEQVDLRETVMS